MTHSPHRQRAADRWVRRNGTTSAVSAALICLGKYNRDTARQARQIMQEKAVAVLLAAAARLRRAT